MINKLKYLWSAAFYQGYFNNKDIKELLENKQITVFYDVMRPDFLCRVEEINCSTKLKSKLIEIRKKYASINETASIYEKRCKELGVFIISEDDEDYPYYWKILSGMPRLVYGRGKRELINTLENGAVAIVGSRNCSNYSKVATTDFTMNLVKNGITIISGMADGIDRIAHEVTLKNNGKTIAFLAGGVDNIYPWCNKDVYEGLIEKGLVISEMPPGTKAQKQYFPSRNRLISGISDGCLIMEAGIHSGTLHTASFAAAQGKCVFVLPNTIYSENSIGGLELIADGARILLSVEDVISEVAECCFYKLLSIGKKSDVFETFNSEDSNSNKVLEQLKVKSLTADELVRLTSISYTELSVLLSELEIKGDLVVERGKYSLTR